MFTINCKGNLLAFEKPLVMGIVNITPDSFYEGSRMNDTEAALFQIERSVIEGADIIDIGGQSTKPGSIRLETSIELERVIPVLQKACAKYPDKIFSIDTYNAEVAEKAVFAGASIVNDVSAGNIDENMIKVVARLKVPYICMHMRDTPEVMQQDPVYTNLLKEIIDFFILKTEACKRAGIVDVIIDPGFGFGKTISHNYELLQNLSLLNMFGLPIMVGLSRKSFIYRTLGLTATEALNGTTVLNTIALGKGASLLRVHDVKAARETVTLYTRMIKELPFST